MNLPSKWKPILIRLSEAMILMVALLAAWVLGLWLADDGGFEAIYVAIAALLGGLLVARRWLKQAGSETGTKTAVFPQPINWRQAAPTSELSTLRQQIETHFDLDELRVLAADLALNYENLGGETLTRKANALVELCQRHGRLPDLSAHLRRNRPQVEWIAPVVQPLTSQAQRLREKLLNRVETIWIEGVLQQSIHTEILKLTMSYRPEATGQRAWQLVLKQKGEANQTVPPERSLLDIFNRSGRDLLILGEPGSGKTTTMLQLAKSLIVESRQDPAAPIPLVLNLSSWAQKRPIITGWLVEEVFIQYGLNRDLTRSGIKQNQFLYLLDGMDEVLDSKDRAACIKAINEFKVGHAADMVICSRTVEYEALSNQLVMGTAVEIQPLTDEQIDDYLSHEGLELQAVRATLAHDQTLKELAQTPLLLGLMTLAYRNLSREELKPLANKEARRHHLFDHYVAQMFARRPLPPNTNYSQEQAITWLINLAYGMMKNGLFFLFTPKLGVFPHSLFVVSVMSDHWSRYTRVLTGSTFGLVFGIVVGLIFGSVFGVNTFLFVSVSLGLIFGVIIGTSDLLDNIVERYELSQRLKTNQSIPWWNVKMIIQLYVGLLYGLKAYIKQLMLRWELARAGILPFPFSDSRLIAYLDAMHDRILLRRVGGGWIFVHRSLMEYFAERSPDGARHGPNGLG